MEISTIVITVAALAAIAWLAFLVANSMRGRGKEEVAPNLAPGITDDTLESKRLDKTLASAVVLSGILALSLPIYFVGEQSRQDGFVEEFDQVALERGAHLFEEFQCGNCHGVDGGGGAAAYVEKRSGISVAWSAPAINTVFYRYTPEEVRYWLVYGRANSPMPAWGLDGGGPLNDQQIDELMEYLQSADFILPQDDALLLIQPSIDQALSRLETADTVMTDAIAAQGVLVESVQAAPALVGMAEALAGRAVAMLNDAGDGIDVDGDGLPDRIEQELTDIFAEAGDSLGDPALVVTLNPEAAQTGAGEDDLDLARRAVAALESVATGLRVTADNQEKLLSQALGGLAFLEQAQQEKKWEVDITAVADVTFGGDVETAGRALGLFNANCARCHTAGYSAGIPLTQSVGSGALGPALWNGRPKVQFLNAADMVTFITKGSENGVPYGVNGVGSGRMPGFGPGLSLEDLELIVQYLRGDTLTGD
ncbi:MAG: c-type cytochrome [Acidimicrobiia bacterium]|nr:c-type cytochrome [Acidimicrobiia bacterium]